MMSSTASSLDDQNGHAVWRRRRERRARNRWSKRAPELLAPSIRSQWRPSHPSLRHVPWNDYVGANQSASGSGEASQEGDADAKRRIRDDSKWPSRQSHVGSVSLHHRDIVIGKVPPKILSSSWV